MTKDKGSSRPGLSLDVSGLPVKKGRDLILRT